MEKVNGITELLKECKENTISFLLTHSNMLNDKNRFVFEENGLEKPFVLVDVDDICYGKFNFSLKTENWNWV